MRGMELADQRRPHPGPLLPQGGEGQDRQAVRGCARLRRPRRFGNSKATMKSAVASNCETSAAPTRARLPSVQPTGSLLETIRASRERVWNGLTDEEFNFFIHEQTLPSECGFAFLCFHDGWVTLSVPGQDGESWHPKTRWVPAFKEAMAADIAQKHGLYLAEPPDKPTLIPAPGAAHHLRLYNDMETIVIAHPEFLKIRLYSSITHRDIPLAPDLLHDLSALYQGA